MFIRILLRRIIFKIAKNSILFKRLDLHLEDILKKKFPAGSEFNFVQVGANDGISHDWLYDFVKERKSSGIVIEPLHDFFTQLKENYSFSKDVIPLQYAVHATAKEINLYRVQKEFLSNYPDWAGGIASFSAEHLHSSGLIDPSHIIQEKVPAKPLNDILEKNYKAKKIDLFQIDTEGYDLEILKMLDLTKFTPSYIKMEYVVLSKDEIIQAKQLLSNSNYNYFFEGGDLIAVRKN